MTEFICYQMSLGFIFPSFVIAHCSNVAVSVSLVCIQYCSRTAARQLDRNLTFHKLVAYMIAFHTGIILAEDVDGQKQHKSENDLDLLA